MPGEQNIAAIVLAAGYSSRAPHFKPLLALGDSTVIEQAIHNFRQAGIHDITVVVGHRADDLTPVLDRSHVRWVFNEKYSEGMYSSVITGVKALASGVKACFLLPGDMPLVKSHTLKVIYRAYCKLGSYICYPTLQGQRGHPPLISSRLFPKILSWDGPGGLRPLLAQYETRAYEVEVLDGGILLDIDTAADYTDICILFEQRDVPTPGECEAILAKRDVPELVVKHSRLVSEVARRLADRLNQAGLQLNTGLVTAAGLLHDLAKGRPDHARCGAKILRRLGYPKVAGIIASHTDIAFEEGFPVDEAAVVYLADKLVKGDRIVSIDERFHDSLRQFAADAAVLPVIIERLSKAQSIGKKVEQFLGVALGNICIPESRKVDQR